MHRAPIDRRDVGHIRVSPRTYIGAMHRTLYLVGAGYLAICAAVVMRPARAAPVSSAEPPAPAVNFEGNAQQWYTAIKPYCNQVEVVLAQRQHPAPSSLDGQGLSAACYALGGKLDLAREVIDRLPASNRARAAGIVFDVAHPVADAGDDKSAGPIMELVVEYWPNHYMALYHAGMSEYVLGDPVNARRNLTAFLEFYQQNDGWASNARAVLEKI